MRTCPMAVGLGWPSWVCQDALLYWDDRHGIGHVLRRDVGGCVLAKHGGALDVRRQDAIEFAEIPGEYQQKEDDDAKIESPGAPLLGEGINEIAVRALRQSSNFRERCA